MATDALTLLPGPGTRVLLRREQWLLDRDGFLAQARAMARSWPEGRYVINLCDDRGHFLLGFTSALLAGRTTLLPQARTPRVLREIAQRHAPATVIDDDWMEERLQLQAPDAGEEAVPQPMPGQAVAIGFTSGSTGEPKASAKTWANFLGSTQRNLEVLRRYAPVGTILATVPTQHMYGIETCVLLPLLGPYAVACERPMFPQDLAASLARLPQPVVLVTTPVHLRSFVDAGLVYRPPAVIISATAPLTRDLAIAAEDTFGAPLLEVFGSTETCIIAHRRTARDERWTLYPGLGLQPVAEGTQVHAPYLDGPVLLHDHVEISGERSFQVRGRAQDMVEIGGKRCTLGEITTRLLAIPGVKDSAVLQAIESGPLGVQRIIAFVVAPGVDDAAILAALRESLDPVFLPRKLVRLEKLPRNETGKLQRSALLDLLH